MSSTTWTSTGSTNWYTAGNWSGGVPTVSTSGTETVLISGAVAAQPTLSPLAVGAPGTFTVDVNGFVLKETQLDGQFITLTAGAALTLQGIALGNYRGTSGDTAPGGTISNLTDVNGTLASYDTHMTISATGTDSLVSNDVNENFGELFAGAGNKLNLTITPGGNPQSINAFLNYGLIEAGNGGVITIGTALAANGTTNVFANPGWIEALGGTIDATAFIADDANVPNGAGTPDGYIEIGGSGSVALLGGAAAKEDVLFLDGTNNVLTLANNNSFQGTITGLTGHDTIFITGATGTPILSYTGSLLTVGETNSGGTVTNTVTIDIGPGQNLNSIIGGITRNGVVIETGANQFTLQASGAGFPLANFEDPTQYLGGVAPGSSIVAGETVTVLPTSLADLTTSLANNGVILLDGTNANFESTAPITGSGTIVATGGAIVDLLGSTTNTIDFGAGVNNLYLGGTGTASFGGVIAGENGDIITLANAFLTTPPSIADVGLSFNAATGVLTVTDTIGGTTLTDHLTFAGAVPGTFSASLGSGGIIITDVPCFAAGTRILTPNGDRLVQDLRVGDDVLVVRAKGDAVQKIVWTGSRTVDLARHARPEKVIPVRILAGALGAGLPERDLVLSPDHCLFIDGYLIEAKTLINGATIIQDSLARTVTYHHIETETHEIVLAEGVPAETYLDSGNRHMFEGGAFDVLHPDFAPASRDKACAELLLDGPVVQLTRQRLLNRALSLGFTPTASIDLTVKAGLEKLSPEADSLPEKLVFALPRPVAAVDLLSSIGVPAHVSASPADHRRLGVAIAAVTLVADGQRHAIALDDPAHDGFYDMETSQRWTNGAARLALPAFTGRATLEIRTNGQAARWAAPRKPAAVRA